MTAAIGSDSALWIKICGVTCVADAVETERAGANAIGLNFVPSSKRFLTDEEAWPIRRALSHVEVIGIVADAPIERMRAMLDSGLVDRLQLHGSEPRSIAVALGDGAYRAVRLTGPESVDDARRAPGSMVLVDAAHGGALGGTGHRFDWRWIAAFVRERDVVIAGGLHPENVGDCVSRLRPFGVDVASGVESDLAPRIKDPERVRAFVARAREAFARLSGD